jgi:hypothetical protein
VLEWGGRTLGSRRFRAPRARRKDVPVRLPASALEDLRSGGRLTVIVRSLEALGRTRVIRARLDLPAF